MSTAPTTTSPLPDLLRRVREANGRDLKLDLHIARAVYGRDLAVMWECPALTTDVNAVLALIAERLPGWDWAHGYDSDKNVYRAEVWGEIVYRSKDAPTPALALLAAALEAIIAQEQP